MQLQPPQLHGKQACLGFRSVSVNLHSGSSISLRSSLPLSSQTGLEQPETFLALLHKTHGKRSDWEYPFAIAGVNITFMLIDALGILPVALGRSKNAQLVPCGPFLRILQHEKKARCFFLSVF